LIKLGNPAREPLRAATRHADAEVRWRARYALAQLQDSLALPPPNLARALYRSAALARTRPDNRATAIRLYKEVAERFPKTLWAAAARERLAALARPQNVGKAPPPSKEHVARLIARLRSPDWAVRQQASHELALLGDAVRDALEIAARSPDAELAWRAQRLLARITPMRKARATAPQGRKPTVRFDRADLARAAKTGGFADLDRLVDTLGSPDRDRVSAARELLLNIGDEAVEPLVRGLERCDEVTCVEVAALLQELTGESLGTLPERWLAWWQTQRRR
ncbi:hypothetical protein HQ576_04195, partial [bacterium]|nr:hypothetical protein [bacterium]